MLEIFQDAAGEYRFRIKGTNGQIVITSEGYTRRWDAWCGFQAMRQIVRDDRLPIYYPEWSNDDD